MTVISHVKPYAGPAVLSHGFRPFFLLASIWAGLVVLVWPTEQCRCLVLWA